MKGTSVPEQTILFYTRKYITPNVKNNKDKVNRYTADVSFEYNRRLYDVEYDSYSQHHEKQEKDEDRNVAFKEHNYTVIRFRDKNLPILKNCINISLDFPNYSKKTLQKVKDSMELYLSMFNIFVDVNIYEDIEIIRQMYRDYND